MRALFRDNRTVAAVLSALAAGTMAAAGAAQVLSPAKAAAQVLIFCGKSEEMAARLEKKFGETPVARGQVSADTLLVVFARPDGESFTVLRVHASGKACVVTSGRGWESLAADSGEAL